MKLTDSVPVRFTHMLAPELRGAMGSKGLSTEELAAKSATPERLIILMRAGKVPITRAVAETIRNYTPGKAWQKVFESNVDTVL